MCLIYGFDGPPHINAGPFPGLAFDEITPANVFHALLHIRQPITSELVGRPKSMTIVLDRNGQYILGQRHIDADFRSLGMFNHIMHRFLYGQADIVAGLAGNFDFMGQILHMKAAAQLHPAT